MVMRSNFKLLLLLFIITGTTRAQNDQSPSLNIGDQAPPLRVREWIKGTPVQRFQKGKVYVVECWATWCAPCKAAMPHLSALACQYKDRITILGIDIMEEKTTSMGKVKAFVDSMGQRMDYNVGAEYSNFMVARWLEALGEQGIPKSFVVDAEGKLTWVGHPKDLAEVLSKIVNDTWNIKDALAKRNMEKHWAKLDEDAYYDLFNYTGDSRTGVPARPDSALKFIDEVVRKEPKLKYAPRIVSRKFSLLLKKNLQEAYEYGKVAMVTYTYDDPPYDVIFGDIEWYSNKINLPAELYRLGAEAYQAQIDHIPYPELVNTSKLYNNMAKLYWRANNKSQAIDAQQKAIEALKSKKDFSRADMALFESRLQQYRNR